MDKSKSMEAEAVCSQEALALLNCVADPSYDQDKCLVLLNSLRSCILQKVCKYLCVYIHSIEPSPLFLLGIIYIALFSFQNDRLK